jgi:hypothetical protein
LIFTTALAFGQRGIGTVKGVLQDSASAQSLPDATVSVMASKDSTLISFTLTSNSGFFEVKNLDAGDYYLLISYQGFETLKRSFAINPGQPVVDLQAVRLQQSYKTLSEVVVSDMTPIKVKGDTLAFNANAFKTKPNATVEDLLKKLPGVQVERDGAVKAQGENVQKVYVDGKEFFGTDPKLATRNLTADMIDEVEVFDDMSEQAKFNRIDDGSRSKAINLKLKKDKKKGIFGRVYGGYGTDERYDGGVTANFFKGAAQVSLIGKLNNTNNMNFSMTDQMGMFGSGGGMMMGGGGRGMTVPTGSSGFGSSGITRTGSIGLNYRDTWSPRADFSGSYFFNDALNENDRSSYRQTFLGDSAINRQQQAFARNNNANHRVNFRLNWAIDSFNSIVYTPSLSIQNSERQALDTLSSMVDAKSTDYRINESRTASENAGTGLNWNNNLLWRKKFRKLGRTLSVNLSNTYSMNDRDGSTRSLSQDFNAAGDRVRQTVANQQYTQESGTDNYGVSLSYTEPLARDKVLELNYAYNNNNNSSDRQTWNFNPVTGKYDAKDVNLSNHFENSNEISRYGTNFRVMKKKYNYQLGLQLQKTLLESNNLSTKSEIRQRYSNLFPTASFNYQFARSRSLRFNYRGRTNQPSATQLQPIKDTVSNPVYQTEGNPNLNQEFSNNFNLTYNFFDMLKFRNLFANISFSNTYNKIVNSTTQLPFGKQLSRPVNVNGAYNINGNLNFGLPIKRMQGGNFNTTTRVNYDRNVSLLNGRKNYIKNALVGQDLRLNYTFKELLDLGVSAGLTYNSVQYTIQEDRNDDYYTKVFSIDATYSSAKGFILSSDFDYNAYAGRSDGFNQSYAMWNASVAQQLFKSKRGEVKLSVYDILGQNQSISREASDNYIEDIQNTVLQRFFLLSFTYKINRMGGKSVPVQNSRGRSFAPPPPM